jgi:muramidase (phage lysozyme)
LKEAIVISYSPSIPEKWVNDLLKVIPENEFQAKKEPREEMGLMAAIEWAIPTLAVAYLLKPFFDAFLTEAGKDAYLTTKKALQTFIQQSRAIRMKWVAASSSPNKLSKTYDQSLSISLKAQVHSGLTVTVLFSDRVSDEETPFMVEGAFQILEALYQECLKSSEGTDKATEKLSRNNLYLVVNFDEQRWELLDNKQITAKYKNIHISSSDVTPTNTTPMMNSDVFMSYSWDSKAHEQRVFDLTNHLRSNGFAATMDKQIAQQETAINFVKMMHKALSEHPKVIVILSKGYKEKAESFTGGVGEEYQLLINDIKKNHQKYILASFEGRSDDIIPFGLMGRDVIDLSQPDEMQRLFGKLMDHKPYQFVPIAAEKPDLATVSPKPFEIKQSGPSIIIPPPRVTPTGNAGFRGDFYRDVELVLHLDFKNISAKPVSEFGAMIRIPKFLVTERGNHTIEGDWIVIEKQIDRKLFAGQTVSAAQIKFEINHGNIYRVVEAEILTEVYTDDGAGSARFALKDLIKLKPPHKNWMDAQPLDISLFVSE